MDRIVYLVLFLVLVLSLAFSARAHVEHGEDVAYPPDCCGGNDCAPILASSRLQDGSLWVRTKHGETIFPPDFPWRDFDSARSHACFTPHTAGSDAPTIHYCLLGKSGI